MNKLDFAAINQAIDPQSAVPQWLPHGYKRGKEWISPNPTRNDANPGSFTINLIEGHWKDFATGDGGADLVSLYAYLFHDDDQGKAAHALAANHGVRIGDPVTRQHAAEVNNVRKLEDVKPVPQFPVPAHADPVTLKHFEYGEPSAVWEYKDREGGTLMYVCRFDIDGERKQVVPRSWCKHHDGTERWTWRGITGTSKRPLYGLELLAAAPDADAILFEGEKVADAGRRMVDGAVSVSWMGGVETADKVLIKALAGRRVVLWPDFDSHREKLTKEEEAAGVDPATKPYLPMHEQPGIRAMMNFATALKGVAREVVMVGYQIGGKFGGGWDLADAEAEGWTTEDVAAYMVRNSGDPWAIASGKVVMMPGSPPLAPAPTAAANDNTPAHIIPIDASVNPFGWPHLTDKGQPLNTAENLEYMLEQYGIKAKYNEVRKLVRVVIPGRTYSADNEANCVMADIVSIAARNRMPQSMLADYTKLVADRGAHNPVKDWIESKPWDGTSRVQAMCETVTVTGDRSLSDKLIFRWLVSAIAALYMPSGFESHGALVFTGMQGQGKTKWFKSLVAPNMHDLILAGAVLDPNNKDTVTNAISHWLVELGELDATFRKADIARLKSFITNATDKVRRPYDRVESVYQRRTVFFASVNEERYLVDDTGNRRWWTVPAIAVNYEHTIDVQQLWAELLTLWRGGEQHWLSKEEFELLNVLNAEHESIDPVEELILGAFNWQQPDAFSGQEMTATDVLVTIGYEKPNKVQATHASKVLKKLTKSEPVKRASGRFFKMPVLTKRQLQAFGHHDETRPF